MPSLVLYHHVNSCAVQNVAVNESFENEFDMLLCIRARNSRLDSVDVKLLVEKVYLENMIISWREVQKKGLDGGTKGQVYVATIFAIYRFGILHQLK